MPTAAVALADGRQIVQDRRLVPRIRAHRNLCSETRWTNAHAIHAIGEEKIRRELVINLNARSGEIEEEHSAVTDPKLLDEFLGAKVLLVKRSELAGDAVFGDNFF